MNGRPTGFCRARNVLVLWVNASTATAMAWLTKASPMMRVETIDVPLAAARSATSV